MRCVQCGRIAGGSGCIFCGEQGLEARTREQGNVVTWPFYQPGWLGGIWMPLSGSILFPFGMLITLGWSVVAISRRGWGIVPSLPRTRELASILKHGFVVAMMAFLYFVIPVAILSKLTEYSWALEIWDTAIEILKVIFHQSKTPLMVTFSKFLLKIATDALAPLIYTAIAAPLFLVARVRYAMTGQVRSFFNLPRNIMTCFRQVGEILLYIFLAVVTRAAIGFLLALVAPTVIGVIIPIALNAANVWILAYLAGNLAREILNREGTRAGQPFAALKPRPAPQPEVEYPPALATAHDAVAEGLPVPPPSLPSPVCGKASLYCRKGALQDQAFPVLASGYVIGRSPAVAQLIIASREVSSQHVRVQSGEDGIWIEDMNSTNGTFYCFGTQPWQRLSGRVRLPYGSRFRISRDAAEFEVIEVRG